MAPSVGPNERARPRLPYSLRPSALWKLLRNMTMATATSRLQRGANNDEDAMRRGRLSDRLSFGCSLGPGG